MSRNSSVGPERREGVHVVSRFRFESGAELEGLKVGYVTYGRPNAERSNAVLLVPGTSNGRHWAEQHVGPGRMYDTDKYFLIATDAIGGGTSSQPADGLGPAFPRYTIRDLVRAEHALVTEGLGLRGLHAVAGPSMGSFQGVEWGIAYPGFVRGLVLIVPAARSDRHFQSIVDALTATVTLDPAYGDGRYAVSPTEGIRRAGAIYFPWVYSDEWLRTLTSEEEYRRAQCAIGDGWAGMWDANALLWRYHASRNHDAAVPFGGDMAAALGSIRARCLLLVSPLDRTIPPYLSRELHDRLHDAVWAEIPTIRGHLGGSRPIPGSPEWLFMAERIGAFLDGL